ncbi:hypothetical protein LSH36_16g07021 [Paralvinella palmiformis]|uniref:Uncharacterized protein n=1 Tax=Paralvinella palmiformis TaxID=53620 RepID=A0AAD9KBB1_9ANNE|nr:hypothetical protein LSH36_16g07021 [Paralvinella palmiformis]
MSGLLTADRYITTWVCCQFSSCLIYNTYSCNLGRVKKNSSRTMTQRDRNITLDKWQNVYAVIIPRCSPLNSTIKSDPGHRRMN